MAQSRYAKSATNNPQLVGAVGDRTILTGESLKATKYAGDPDVAAVEVRVGKGGTVYEYPIYNRGTEGGKAKASAWNQARQGATGRDFENAGLQYQNLNYRGGNGAGGNGSGGDEGGANVWDGTEVHPDDPAMAGKPKIDRSTLPGWQQHLIKQSEGSRMKDMGEWYQDMGLGMGLGQAAVWAGKKLPGVGRAAGMIGRGADAISNSKAGKLLGRTPIPGLLKGAVSAASAPLQAIPAGLHSTGTFLTHTADAIDPDVDVNWSQAGGDAATSAFMIWSALRGRGAKAGAAKPGAGSKLPPRPNGQKQIGQGSKGGEGSQLPPRPNGQKRIGQGNGGSQNNTGLEVGKIQQPSYPGIGPRKGDGLPQILQQGREMGLRGQDLQNFIRMAAQAAGIRLENGGSIPVSRYANGGTIKSYKLGGPFDFQQAGPFDPKLMPLPRIQTPWQVGATGQGTPSVSGSRNFKRNPFTAQNKQRFVAPKDNNLTPEQLAESKQIDIQQAKYNETFGVPQNIQDFQNNIRNELSASQAPAANGQQGLTGFRPNRDAVGYGLDAIKMGLSMIPSKTGTPYAFKPLGGGVRPVGVSEAGYESARNNIAMGARSAGRMASPSQSLNVAMRLGANAQQQQALTDIGTHRQDALHADQSRYDRELMALNQYNNQGENVTMQNNAQASQQRAQVLAANKNVMLNSAVQNMETRRATENSQAAVMNTQLGTGMAQQQMMEGQSKIQAIRDKMLASDIKATDPEYAVMIAQIKAIEDDLKNFTQRFVQVNEQIGGMKQRGSSTALSNLVQWLRPKNENGGNVPIFAKGGRTPADQMLIDNNKSNNKKQELAIKHINDLQKQIITTAAKVGLNPPKMARISFRHGKK